MTLDAVPQPVDAEGAEVARGEAALEAAVSSAAGEEAVSLKPEAGGAETETAEV